MMGGLRSSILIERKSYPRLQRLTFSKNSSTATGTSSYSAKRLRSSSATSTVTSRAALSGTEGNDTRRTAVLIIHQIADEHLTVGVRFSGFAPDAAEVAQVVQ